MVILFVIAVSDVPFTRDGFGSGFLRARKTEWICGKFLFILLMACIGQLIVVLVSVILLWGNAFSNNAWSFPFYKLVREGVSMTAGMKTAYAVLIFGGILSVLMYSFGYKAAYYMPWNYGVIGGD